MNKLINYLPSSKIFNYFSIKANGIAHRKEYETCLPDDIFHHIFMFLPLEDQTSTSLARVSYQFYIISKPTREKFSNDLTQICQQITKIVADSFYRSSAPAFFGVHYDFTEEQKFFVEFDYIYYQNRDFKTIQCKFEKQIVNDEFPEGPNTVDRAHIRKLNLTDTNFVLVDKIKFNQGNFLTTKQSSKIKFKANPNLKRELKSVANTVMQRINNNR